MCMQLNELDLTDVKVLEEQLTGVDTTYFQMMIDELRKHQEETGSNKVDTYFDMFSYIRAASGASPSGLSVSFHRITVIWKPFLAAELFYLISRGLT